MKKITYWIKKNFLFLLPILVVIIYLISIWNNNSDTFGDTTVPLNPLNNIEKSLYMWELDNHGISQWRYMMLLWQLPFYFFSRLGIPPYAGIKIYMAGIMAIGFIFAYLFFITFFKNTKYENKKLGILFSFIFVLSAASVDILPTTIFLSALPLCAYLLIKYLDTAKIRYIIFFSLAINYSYLAHLPQAKYLFVLLGELFFVLLLYNQVRSVSLKNLIIKLINFSIFTLLLNGFILTPFLYEVFKSGGTYGFYTQNVDVYNGNAELNTATLPYVTRLFTSSLVNNVSVLGRFLSSQLFSIWTFLLLIIAFLSIYLVKSRREKNIVYLCILGFVSFMFLAKGPNPPFGEIYKFLLFNVPIFKVFRTTSMSVIGATVFFSIMLIISVYYIEKKIKKILLFILVTHLIVFAPIYFGVRLVVFEGKGKIQKGYSIPDEYYQMGNKLDNIKEDIKILSLPLDDSYTYKDWPYMGQSIMGWITKKSYIHDHIAGYPGFTDNLVLQKMNTKEACFFTAINNIGYILGEKDSRIADYSLSKFNFSATKVLENTYFKLEKVNSGCFLPHIYAATDTFLFEGENNSIPDVVRFINNKQDIVIGLNTPINKKKNIQTAEQIVIEAYPKETSDFSDNVITKKVFSDISSLPPLNFWTYSFNTPLGGNYEMVIDTNGDISKEQKVFKKGTNTVKIPVVKYKNLIDLDLLNAFKNDKKVINFLQEIKDWQGENIYLLSLKYNAHTPGNILFTPGSILFTIEEMERHFNGRLPDNFLNATLFSQELSSQKPGDYTYQAIIKTDINAQSATVKLQRLAGDIIIESFDVEKVSRPKVFFTLLKDEKKAPPKVDFVKINPTKYNVDVKNAKGSYNLVFSESFSPDWKVYIKTCSISCDKLQDWSLEPIPEERHYMVNGFANGWYISPSDSKNKANYQLTVEYYPQRVFLIGTIISFLTLILLLFLLLLKLLFLRNK